MIAFIGAIGEAILLALAWGAKAMVLLIKLLALVAEGVSLVMVIRNRFGLYHVQPI